MLAPYDNSYPWSKIAEGITRSGIHQQVVTPGPYNGTYPDSWIMSQNLPQPVYINPEDILKNVYYLTGRSPNLTTLQLGSMLANDPTALLITSRVDDLQSIEYTANKYLSFTVENPIGETSRILISGWNQPVGGGVWEGETALTQVANIDQTNEGCQKKGAYWLIRIFHEEPVEIISLGIPPAKVAEWGEY
jgi:hypothetical protein